MNARVHIVPQSSFTATVNYCGVDMECTYEYEEGEPAIWSPIDRAHPGSPSNAVLYACKVGGVDISELLSLEQRERIEEKLIEQMENA